MRQIRSWRRRLAPPNDLLGRLRWSFLAFSLFFVVTYVPQVALTESSSAALRATACCSVTALAWWWVRCYRRGTFPLLGLPFEVGTFFVAAMAVEDPYRTLGLLYIGVNFRSLYGNWWKTVLFVSLTILAFFVPIELAAEAGRVDHLAEFFQSVPGVPVLATIARLVAVACERGERAAARENVLSRLGLSVALAADADSVRRAGETAAVALVGGPDKARAEVLVDELPPVDSDATTFPLVGRDGTVGHLLVHTRTAIVAEAMDSLAVLAGQLTLGLTSARLKEDLRYRASHDALTALPNRSAFVDAAQEALDAAVAHGTPFTLVLLDLDGFKAINDELGHGAGDQLLVAVAERLRNGVEGQGQSFRLGGDEFVLLLDGNQPADDVVERMRARLEEPVAVADTWVRVGASMGIAGWQGHEDIDALLHHADSAMYREKRGRPGRVS